ncbi:MAG: tRNA lysidine(34) synthetase TilS [Flammeovirgaceae bacterium]|nr:MAG: tRNA lysidine(34) synthetase TilS [Flammeovirgaceae bacterium]
MLEQFLNHIEKHTLCLKTDRILLAVSGGIDSMVMLDLFFAAGYPVGVAHANFQLRGAESEQDELFVKAVCQHKGIPFFARQFNTTEYAALNNLSIQMAARELRYAWFDELLEKENYNYLSTAHHLNDSIETVLLNWIHGGASEGLLGIPVKNNHIIRPLLFASRKMIETYATEKKLVWREDASNQTDDYPRNFLRHQVVPKLQALNPSLEETFQLGLEKLKAGHALETLAVNQLREAYFKAEESKVIIRKEVFEKIQHPLMLWYLLREYHFTPAVCYDVVQALRAQPGKRFLSPTHQLVIDRTTLIITPHKKFWQPVEITSVQATASLGPWDMTIEPVTGKAISADAGSALLDKDLVKFPLVWRTWKPGDFFYPLGMTHKKKISDFLIDNKVPLSDKPHVTVLESAGQIMWVVGYRIDNRFKVTAATQQALQFTLHPHFI